MLVISGHFKRDRKYVYAVCDQVPVAAHGVDEATALDALHHGLELYRDALVKRGELDAAIDKFGIKVIRVPLSGLGEPASWSSEKGRRAQCFAVVVPA